MIPRKRLLPAREQLLKAHEDIPENADVSAVDLMLHLICAADIARICAHGAALHGLSEGQFCTLITLRGAGRPLTTGEIARSIGVSDATVSIMITRMLREFEPLVQKDRSSDDKRSVSITLTDAGNRRLNEVLPDHHRAVVNFSSSLSAQEKQTLLELLKKLISPNNP